MQFGQAWFPFTIVVKERKKEVQCWIQNLRDDDGYGRRATEFYVLKREDFVGGNLGI